MKRNLLQLTALLLALPILFSNCATIFGKSIYPFSISTNPTGADISIVNKKGTEIYKGQSPATVKLKSSAGYFNKAEYQVKLSYPGYQEQIIPVNFKLNGWYIGNILIGGLVGMLIVDPISGAMWKLDTPSIDANLSQAATSAMTPTLKIMEYKDISKDIKDHIVRIK